jgi:hypothetical protein
VLRSQLLGGPASDTAGKVPIPGSIAGAIARVAKEVAKPAPKKRGAGILPLRTRACTDAAGRKRTRSPFVSVYRKSMISRSLPPRFTLRNAGKVLRTHDVSPWAVVSRATRPSYAATTAPVSWQESARAGLPRT